MSELLKLKLEDASLDQIAELALRAIGQNASAKKNIDVNIENYSSLIKKSFSQRRKTLKNNLKRHVNVEILKDYNLKRPQELNISDYVNLYKKIYI